LAYADEIALVFVKTASNAPGTSNPAKAVLDHALRQAVFFTEKYPGTVYHWTNLAEIHLMRYELPLAVNALKRARTLAPNDPDIANRLVVLERALTYTK
jgi:cytochrome c-type biogenesis protein CcmH/NrfG